MYIITTPAPNGGTISATLYTQKLLGLQTKVDAVLSYIKLHAHAPIKRYRMCLPRTQAVNQIKGILSTILSTGTKPEKTELANLLKHVWTLIPQRCAAHTAHLVHLYTQIKIYIQNNF